MKGGASFTVGEGTAMEAVSLSPHRGSRMLALGWSEGSELSQLIVHSQLQIELLFYTFPPSHYCT